MVQTNLFGSKFDFIPKCESCGLYRTCKSPKMKPSGRGKYPVLVVGEAPGEQEDLAGRQFVGDSGQLLRFFFEQFNFDMDDFRIINAVNCRPPKNRKPKASELKACLPMVLGEINRFKPNVIFLVGEYAVKSVLGNVYKKDVGGIGRWRGFAIPDQTYKAWLVPVYHPSYLLRNQGDEGLEMTMLDDIKTGLDLINISVPDILDTMKRYSILTLKAKVKRVLGYILDTKPEYLAFDYETNILKPYQKGAKVVTASVCFSPEKAYSFPMYDDLVPLWRKLMESDIKKVGANIKFEQVWTEEYFKVRPKNWVHDVVLWQHTEDQRSKITSLKFQVYLYFGISDYNSKVEKYLTANRGTEFNKIDKVDKTELLKYNALDSLFTYLLFLEQRKRK